MRELSMAVIGTDARQLQVQSILQSRGYSCTNITSMDQIHRTYSCVVYPVRFSDELPHITHKLWGKPCSVFGDAALLGRELYLCSQSCEDLPQIHIYDYTRDPAYTYRNAIATAEGVLVEALTCNQSVISDSRCLVIGYGTCGSVLAQRLKGLQAHVWIAERDERKLSMARSMGYNLLLPKDLAIDPRTPLRYDYVFNTAPSMVLTESILRRFPANVTILDIASAPGGTDWSACKELKLNARHCPGLPGRYSPIFSAEILVDYILSHLPD